MGRINKVDVGPSFSGSSTVGGADADLIADGTLWDVKAAKSVELRQRDVLQLAGYALLDFDDDHHISSAGICLARFGIAVSWPLDRLVGGPIADARDDLRNHLGGAANH